MTATPMLSWVHSVHNNLRCQREVVLDAHHRMLKIGVLGSFEPTKAAVRMIFKQICSCISIIIIISNFCVAIVNCVVMLAYPVGVVLLR